MITFSLPLLNLFCKPSWLRFWPSWLPFWAGGPPNTASMATQKAQGCLVKHYKRVPQRSPMLYVFAAPSDPIWGPSWLKFWASKPPFWTGGPPNTAKMAPTKAQDGPGKSDKIELPKRFTLPPFRGPS